MQRKTVRRTGFNSRCMRILIVKNVILEQIGEEKKQQVTPRGPQFVLFFYPCFITIRKYIKSILFVTHIQVQIHQGQGQGGHSRIDPSLY